MRSSPAANRLSTLVLVVAVHCGVLLALAALTRARLIEEAPEAAPIEVVLIDARSTARAGTGPLPGAPPAASSGFPAQRPQANAPSPSAPALSGAIDWDNEARGAAARQADQDSGRNRRDMAGLSPQARAFQPSVPRPEFHWDHASTHRVEPLPGGGTLINLNDSCVVVVFVIMPIAACRLGKIPARGDLFEHMRDAPEFGAWKER